VLKETLVIQVLKEPKEPKDQKELRDLKELKVLWGPKELKEQVQVLKETLVTQGHKVL
jgi:hypothetical protein